MRLKVSNILALICSALLLTSCFYGCTLKKDKDPAAVDSSQLKNTVMVPYLSAGIQKGQNLVYCSTFQLAWNELRNNIIKDDIKIDGNPEISDYLNSSHVSKGDLFEDCYVAKAGLKKDDIINTINKELRKKFGISAVQLDSNTIENPDDILAYAYLNKKISFKYLFEDLDNLLTFQTESGKKSVESFGIRMYQNNAGYDKMITQVDIIDYQSDDDFIIKLHGENPEDEIILAKTDPEDTLQDTVQVVEKRIKSGSTCSIDANDKLWIPVINFNLNKHYDELENKGIINSKFTGYYIKEALQNLRFRLNKGGAETESGAKLELTLGVTPRKEKNLIFDKPFLVYLKEKDKTYPYVAIWVDNAEIMTQAK